MSDSNLVTILENTVKTQREEMDRLRHRIAMLEIPTIGTNLVIGPNSYFGKIISKSLGGISLGDLKVANVSPGTLTQALINTCIGRSDLDFIAAIREYSKYIVTSGLCDELADRAKKPTHPYEYFSFLADLSGGKYLTKYIKTYIYAHELFDEHGLFGARNVQYNHEAASYIIDRLDWNAISMDNCQLLIVSNPTRVNWNVVEFNILEAIFGHAFADYILIRGKGLYRDALSAYINAKSKKINRSSYMTSLYVNYLNDTRDGGFNLLLGPDTPGTGSRWQTYRDAMANAKDKGRCEAYARMTADMFANMTAGGLTDHGHIDARIDAQIEYHEGIIDSVRSEILSGADRVE